MFNFITHRSYLKVYNFALFNALMGEDRCRCKANWRAFREIQFDFITYVSYSSIYNYVSFYSSVGSNRFLIELDKLTGLLEKEIQKSNKTLIQVLPTSLSNPLVNSNDNKLEISSLGIAAQILLSNSS